MPFPGLCIREGKVERNGSSGEISDTGWEEGKDKGKDQKSVAFKHYSSEQVFLCWMCSLSVLLGVPPYTS